MGGFGSGRYAAGYERGKRCVEGTTNISVSSFKKPLSLSHPTKFTTEAANGNKSGEGIVNPVEKYIRLIFAGYDIHINIDETPCNYGSVRYWFKCPLCDSRRGKLYFVHGHLICRKCADLNYYSQQHTKTDGYYFNRRAEKLGQQLDKDFKFFQVARPVFPPKPKYMKWRKYRQLEWKYYHYMNKGTQIWLQGASAILGRR